MVKKIYIYKPFSIIAVYHIHQSIGVLEIMSVKRSNFVSTAYVPSSKLHALVHESFDVEANGWNCCHNFSKFKTIEYCRFSSSIKTHNQDPDIFFEPAFKKRIPHGNELILIFSDLEERLFASNFVTNVRRNSLNNTKEDVSQ